MNNKAYCLFKKINKKYAMMYKVKSGVYWLGVGTPYKLATNKEMELYKKYSGEIKNVTGDKYDYREKEIYQVALLLLNILNIGNTNFDINRIDEANSKLRNFIYSLDEEDLNCLEHQLDDLIKAHNCVDYFKFNEQILDNDKLIEVITNKYDKM